MSKKAKHKYSNVVPKENVKLLINSQDESSGELGLDDNQSLLEIDILQLEKEWANHPKLYEQFATKLAHARNELEVARDGLKLMEAKTENDIRQFPDYYGIRKATEGAITKAVVLQDDYQEAVKQVRDAKYAVGLLEAMTESLEHRKKALEKECDLFTSQYWSKPRAPENMREELEFADTTAAYRNGRKRG